MKSKITVHKSGKRTTYKKGDLCENDTHSANIIVLCLEDEKNFEVSVVVLRDETKIAGKQKIGQIINWATDRLVKFSGKIELSN